MPTIEEEAEAWEVQADRRRQVLTAAASQLNYIEEPELHISIAEGQSLHIVIRLPR